MIHLFSLPLTPQDRLRYLRDGGRRQRKMLMPFGQGLITSKNLREALGLSLFCPPPPRGMGGAYSFGVSRKGKITSSACPVEFPPSGGTPYGGFHRAGLFNWGDLLALLNIVAGISERLLSGYLEGLIACYI